MEPANFLQPSDLNFCVSVVPVCVQTRSRRAIQERMLRLTQPAAASSDPPAAEALLCLSGSHPARKLPGSSRSASFTPFDGCPLAATRCWHPGRERAQLLLNGGVLLSRWLLSSMDVLRMANMLRSEGRLPAATSIWAVENPLRHHPSRLEAKASLRLGHRYPSIPYHEWPSLPPHIAVRPKR